MCIQPPALLLLIDLLLSREGGRKRGAYLAQCLLLFSFFLQPVIFSLIWMQAYMRHCVICCPLHIFSFVRSCEEHLVAFFFFPFPPFNQMGWELILLPVKYEPYFRQDYNANNQTRAVSNSFNFPQQHWNLVRLHQSSPAGIEKHIFCK